MLILIVPVEGTIAEKNKLKPSQQLLRAVKGRTDISNIRTRIQTRSTAEGPPEHRVSISLVRSADDEYSDLEA